MHVARQAIGESSQFLDQLDDNLAASTCHWDLLSTPVLSFDSDLSDDIANIDRDFGVLAADGGGGGGGRPSPSPPPLDVAVAGSPVTLTATGGDDEEEEEAAAPPPLDPVDCPPPPGPPPVGPTLPRHPPSRPLPSVPLPQGPLPPSRPPPASSPLPAVSLTDVTLSEVDEMDVDNEFSAMLLACLNDLDATDSRPSPDDLIVATALQPATAQQVHVRFIMLRVAIWWADARAGEMAVSAAVGRVTHMAGVK